MNKFQKIFSILLLLLLLTSCVPASSATTAVQTVTPVVPTPTATGGFRWWNDTVFYEIFVRSFYDSDGNGIGDFNGVTQKLDYMQSLGVKGIWLMPINPSPSYHGYDVTDYYAVNPDYGTMDDFKRLLEEAHKRDIKVITDMVLNHTSSQHPWFQSAQTPGSEYTDYYVWSDTDPGTPGPWGAPAWYKASNGKYYYAPFSDKMPDLNYNNPAVQEEAKKIASFWLKDVGVDGFRLDAARYLVEEDGKLADTPANHAFWEEWGQYVRSLNPEAFTVGEIWTGNSTVKNYVDTNTELDSAFNFDLADATLKSVKEGTSTVVRFLLQSTIQDFPEQDNSNFLTNHDQNRVMSQVMSDPLKAKVAASILLTAPGIPFIYYGEEIGMSGTKPDEMIRTPMQWTSDNNAGFTSGTPWEPVNTDYASVNVQKETGDPNSLLEHYRKLIQLRNEHPALQTGKTYVAKSESNKLLSYLRVNEKETILVIINVDDQPVSNYGLSLEKGPLNGSYTVKSLLDDSTYAPLQANASGGFEKYVPIQEIPAFSTIILQLKKQ